jgi:DNA (cytosine-5)-methyltransferase 1
MTARESLLAAISVGDDVQLKSGYLLRITRISEHADPTQRKLKGWVFRRSLHMEGLVSWVSNSNEVFWMKKLVLGDNSDPDFQGMEQYSIQDVVRQVHLKLTNKPFSGESCPDSLGRFECRMRLTLWFMRAQEKGDIKNSKHGSLMNLTAVSCDSYCGEEDEAIRRLAIGNVAKGGSCSHTIAAEQAHLAKESDLAATAKLLDPSLGNSRQCPINADGEDIVTSTRRIEGATADVIEITEDDVIELEEDDNTSSPQIIDLEKLLLDQTLDKCWNSSGPGRLADAIDAVPYERRYTFGDAFCGAGGMARGAVMAGLRIEWAFDFVQDMCDAYRLNFPTTKIACTSSFEFSVKPYGWQVDILHLSPPCKFFSPAHTIPGRQDEENFAASFGIIEMLKKFKPRIATMEQTLGLAIQAKHKEAFHAILSQFHSAGYSVAWKLMDTSQYGVPQTRKRLIIVASAAGELNPGFPPITHSKNWRENGLKPLQTVRNAIAKIPVDWPHHDVAGELANRIRGKGCDWDAQAGTLTTRGGNTNFHPDGRRFTNRENACLQSFPLEHMFDPKHARNRVIEQIGNAVPPLFAYALLNHIKKALQRADGVVNTNADELASGRDDGRDNGRYDEEMMADMVAQTECVDLTEHEEPTDMLDLTMEG